MTPVEVLMAEHRVIEKVLSCLDRMVDRVGRGARLDAASARQALEFFRAFADGCHHVKEERQLFPMLERNGFSPEHGPTAVMRAEHEQGRELLRRIDEAIDGAAAGDVASARAFFDSARRYSALLRAHIRKEDQILFPMALEALAGPPQEELLQRFEGVEHELGNGTHERWLRVADALCERYDVPHDAAGAPSCGCSGPGHAA